jgi:phospholipid/cholesterol/gamma-HCH transport system substrate-binding protein
MNAIKIRDTFVGMFVLVGLGSIAYLSLSVGGARLHSGNTIELFATFDQIADLKARAPVQISGVRVGQVTDVTLDESYRARVALRVDSSLALPYDSSASIVTSGLLGDRYIAIDLGAEDDMLVDGDEIAYTESALVLERILGKFLYNFSTSDD